MGISLVVVHLKLKEGKTITVIKGDITKVEGFRAIVNPANSMMIMGGGVAGAIRRAGGEEIEAQALKHAPVPVGRAVATHAGKLRVDYVIHAPTMERPAMRTDLNRVRKAVNAALKVAENLKIESVAFPGMGTGIGGLDPESAAEAMIDEILAFLKESKHVKAVGLIAYTKDLYEAFLKAIKEKLLLSNS